MTDLSPVLARIDELESRLLRSDPPMVMSSKECAAFLGYTEEHLCRLRKDGQGPKCSKPGKHVKYLRDDAIDWLREHQ